jgi:hypothetical protein
MHRVQHIGGKNLPPAQRFRHGFAAKTRVRIKEAHGLHPVGFWGEKQPSRDGVVNSRLSLAGGLQRPLINLVPVGAYGCHARGSKLKLSPLGNKVVFRYEVSSGFAAVWQKTL